MIEELFEKLTFGIDKSIQTSKTPAQTPAQRAFACLESDAKAMGTTPHGFRRMPTLLLAASCVAIPSVLSSFSLFEMALLAAACGYLVAALARIPFAFGYTPYACMMAFKAYDYLQGGLLMALCFVLASPAFVKNLQNRALLSYAFDRGVTYAEISRLLVAPS